MLAEMDLSNRVVVVTAAGAGIGRATASLLLELGATVVAVDIDGMSLRELEPHNGLRGRITTVVCDVTDEGEIRKLADGVRDEFGSISALVNVAGTNSFGKLDSVSLESWERVVKLNLNSVFLMTREFISDLEVTKGSIVNVASTYGLRANASMPAYSATKAGVVNLTRQIAVDYSPRGVRANAVAPGPVMTPRRREYFAEGHGNQAKSESKTLLDRMAEPREVATVMAFLVSPAASYITGTCVVVDGGALAHAGVVT